jgi:hypothetical protein
VASQHTVTHAKQLAAERIATHAWRTGQSRRAFLTGLCGAATTLLAFNDVSREFQERYGYPALTPELKADVFGLSAAPVYGVDPAQARRRAAGDPVDNLRTTYREDPQPSFRTYGPRDLAEWRRFCAVHGVGPA